VSDKLTNNPHPKDDALEALDFIVNVLKEHEKDLDKLINELATVTEQIGNKGELSSKVDKVEEKINILQKEVSNLIGYLSSAPKLSTQVVTIKEQPISNAPLPSVVTHGGPPVILRCKQWEDFHSLALSAQTLSFSYNEDDKTFQADALKGTKIITYNGLLPKFSSLLKTWLSRQLNVPEQSILEGVLAIS
jgi:hypothetical protein